MQTRTLLGAALAVAALATPATAEPSIPQNAFVYSVSTTGAATASTRVDATCVFQADRWTDDYGATTVHAIGTTTGGNWISVRCELFQHGWEAGDETWWADLGAVYGTGRMGFIPERNVTMCVTATGLFAERYVETPRTCRSI